MPIFGKKEKVSEDELFQRGSVAFSRQEWDKASEHLRIVVGQNPHHTQARVMLSMSLVQDLKADEAMEHARYLVNEEPQNPFSHQCLGACFQLKGENEEAIRAFSRSLEIQENPTIRGIICFLKTPDLPTIKIDSVDKSMSSIFARALSSATTSPVTEEIMDEESISELSKIGSKVHDDIRATKDHATFLNEIADACLENDAYVKVEDLLKKFDSIDQLNSYLQQLEAETGIKGRLAKVQHLEFVQFEKA